ncbi:MerR family transcriptional regulator [Nocardia crassostreae]|uniref:MerR family transcriptional regulator n=1 Tax=Nocardia crassostreae TaxID=53428 RepID=UPI0009FFFAB2|nr:MerR family transcriptional regulator [Nocardia crassostreae]
MLIGELSHRTGVPTRLLRYYEEQGLLVPQRDSNGYRTYADDAPATVTRIRDLLEAGLPTRAIRQLLPCATDTGYQHCDQSRKVVTDGLSHLEAQIESLTRRHALLTRHQQSLLTTPSPPHPADITKPPPHPRPLEGARHQPACANPPLPTRPELPLPVAHPAFTPTIAGPHPQLAADIGCKPSTVGVNPGRCRSGAAPHRTRRPARPSTRFVHFGRAVPPLHTPYRRFTPQFGRPFRVCTKRSGCELELLRLGLELLLFGVGL